MLNWHCDCSADDKYLTLVAAVIKEDVETVGRNWYFFLPYPPAFLLFFLWYLTLNKQVYMLGNTVFSELVVLYFHYFIILRISNISWLYMQ